MNPEAYKYTIDSNSLIAGSKNVPQADFHIHTNFTDGKASVEKVVETAMGKNLSAICFTEHTEPWHHKDVNWFENYAEQVEKQKAIYSDKIEIFLGIEAPLVSFDGSIEATPEMISRVDFILGAAHRYPTMEGRRVADLSPEEAIELEFRTLETLINRPEVDCIAHIGATCSKYVTPFPQTLTEELIKLAARKNKIVEINPVYHKPLLDFIKMCARNNAQVSLGSNAHGFGDIGMVARNLSELLS